MDRRDTVPAPPFSTAVNMLVQRANGDVIYCADGWNNLPPYRITGWDKLDRQQGTLHLAAASTPTAAGTGLSARYAAAGSGAAPVREGVDPQIWLGDAANKDKRATVARFHTEPLRLTAGRQVPVKLAYKKTGSGELHLSWESVSQSIEHVPASALFPQ